MAGASVQFVEDSTNGSVTSIPSPSITTTTGNAVLVAVGYTSAAAITCTVSDGTNTYTEVAGAAIHDTTSDYRFRFFVARNITGVTGAITATFGSAVPFRAIAVNEFSGLDTSASLVIGGAGQVQATPTTTTDATTSGNVNVTAQPAVLWGMSANLVDVNIPAVGTGFTDIGTAFDFEGAPKTARFEFKRTTSTGNQAVTFTATAANDDVATGVVALLEAGGGGGGTAVPVFRHHYATMKR